MFYRIVSNPYGFTSNFNFALSQLWAFDNVEQTRDDGRSDIAVVDWTDPNWFYADPTVEIPNVWEYYCHQPMGVGVDQIKGGVMDGLAEYDLRHDKYAEKQSCLPAIRALVKKYIKPKDHILQAVNDFWMPQNGNEPRILGVHYRDTDMPAIHGRQVPLELAFERIQELRKKLDVSAIFLATECQTALERFKEWADHNWIMLIHTDCFRVAPGVVSEFMQRTEIQGNPESFVSTVAKQLHVHEYEIETNIRPLHRYKLGLEVMMDVLLLAKCPYFLHGYSGVANLTTFFSEAPVENIFTYS